MSGEGAVPAMTWSERAPPAAPGKADGLLFPGVGPAPSPDAAKDGAPSFSCLTAGFRFLAALALLGCNQSGLASVPGDGGLNNDFATPDLAGARYYDLATPDFAGARHSCAPVDGGCPCHPGSYWCCGNGMWCDTSGATPVCRCGSLSAAQNPGPCFCAAAPDPNNPGCYTAFGDCG